VPVDSGEPANAGSAGESDRQEVSYSAALPQKMHRKEGLPCEGPSRFFQNYQKDPILRIPDHANCSRTDLPLPQHDSNDIDDDTPPIGFA
jgi:hypothetical protein